MERSLDPSLVGIPAAVVQYNPYSDLADLPVEANRRMDHSNGSLIAVSYEVRGRAIQCVASGRPYISRSYAHPYHHTHTPITTQT